MVVSQDELARYCKLDEPELIAEAVALAGVTEARLKQKGCADTPATHGAFCLAVKAMTRHELDNPGERIPQGIQDMINELKIVKPAGGGGA